MATEVVTPQIESAAPPASPEPVSTPAAETTPATTTTTTATPAAVATEAKPGPRPGEDDLQYLERYQKEQAEKAATTTATETTPAVEVKPEETKPEVKEPVKEAAKPEVKAEEEDELQLQALGIMTPKDLSDKAKEVKELQDLKANHPDVWNGVMATLRKAGQAAEFIDLFPDKEAATFARDEATVFTGFRDDFAGQKDVKDTRALLENIAKLTVQVDENGKAVVDGQGNPIQDGSFMRFMDNIRQIEFEHLRGLADKTQDQELKAALDIIGERLSPTSRAQDDLPEHLKAREAEIAKREAASASKEEKEQHSKQAESKERVMGLIDKDMDARWAKIEKKWQGPKVVLDALKDKVLDAVGEKIDSNPLYISQRNELSRLPISQRTEQRKAELVNRYVEQVFAQTAAPILKEAGLGVVAQSEATKHAAGALKEQSRSEIRGASAPAAPARPKTSAELMADIKKTMPDLDDVQALEEWNRRRVAQ